MMKRRVLISLLLMVLMACSIGLISVNAVSSGATLILTPIQAMPGEEFSTTLCVEEGSEIVDFQIELTYDSNLVHLISADPHKNSSGEATINTDLDGVIKINYTQTSENTVEQTPIVDLVFDVDDYAGIGSYDFLKEKTGTIKRADRIVGSDMVEVPLNCDFTKLKLYEAGDIDLNGAIEIRDVTCLRRYLASLMELSDYQRNHADVYYDQDVNIRDAVYIQKYLACYEVDRGNRANVYFYAADGTLLTTRSVTRGNELMKLPEVPALEGLDPGTWSTSASELNEPDFSCLSKDLKVYAFYSDRDNQEKTLYFDANGGSCEEEYRKENDRALTEAFPIPAREGFSFDGWYTDKTDGNPVSEENIEDLWPNGKTMTVYAHWSIDTFYLSFSEGSRYTITVTRTDSPIAHASNGRLSNGAKIYYGDQLSVTYTASSGYYIASHGETEITVRGDVTKDDIYANAKVKTYNVTVRCKSVNGTMLRSYNVSGYYGNTATIQPPEIPGYVKPAPSKVIYNENNREIVFTYSLLTSSTALISSGDWWVSDNDPKITYQVYAEYRNRTANSVQVRIKWTQSIKAGAYYPAGQFFNGSVGGVTLGDYQITSNTTWSSSASVDRVQDVFSNWITIPVTATQANLELLGTWWDNYGLSGTWEGKMTISGY